MLLRAWLTYWRSTIAIVQVPIHLLTFPRLFSVPYRILHVYGTYTMPPTLSVGSGCVPEETGLQVKCAHGDHQRQVDFNELCFVHISRLFLLQVIQPLGVITPHVLQFLQRRFLLHNANPYTQLALLFTSKWQCQVSDGSMDNQTDRWSTNLLCDVCILQLCVIRGTLTYWYNSFLLTSCPAWAPGL